MYLVSVYCFHVSKPMTNFSVWDDFIVCFVCSFYPHWGQVWRMFYLFAFSLYIRVVDLLANINIIVGCINVFNINKRVDDVIEMTVSPKNPSAYIMYECMRQHFKSPELSVEPRDLASTYPLLSTYSLTNCQILSLFTLVSF